MAFYRITYNEKYDFATLHNWGCTFRCPYCSYKLRSGAEGRPGFAVPKPEKFLTVDEQKKALLEVKPSKVYFMGGEPTVAAELEEMILFAKEVLGAETKLGHTNGCKLPLRSTGKPKSLTYDNFRNAFDAGMKMAANMVYIPGFVDLDELEGCVKFIASLDENIPFHIDGYIPIPGQPYRRPTDEEMIKAESLVKSYLPNCRYSHLTSEEALDLSARDDRFRVIRIAGV